MDWHPTPLLKQLSNKTAVKSRISTTNRTCRWHKQHRKNKKSYSEVYKEVKERAEEVELSTTAEKTKSMAQNRNTRR
jgi:hypothetical protein